MAQAATKLSQGLQLRWCHRAETAAIADLWHVIHYEHGGSNSTPSGYLTVKTEPGQLESAQHLDARLILRSYALDSCGFDAGQAADDVLSALRAQFGSLIPIALTYMIAEDSGFRQFGEIYGDG